MKMYRHMKTYLKLSILLLSIQPLFAGSSNEPNPAALHEGFVEPASEYGPRTWWHWINENVSKEGITKDLEAMKTMGYKGAHVVNLPQGGPAWTVGNDVVGTPIWMEKMEFATKECERLGLELSMGSCAGWVSGGPWITPELSMQDIVWRHTYVKGPTKASVQLPQPVKNHGYFREIAVLAYPTLPGEALPLSLYHPKVSSDIPGIDWSAVIDGNDETFVNLPEWKADEKNRSIIFEFEKPLSVRSLSIQMQEDSRHFRTKLFASKDGKKWEYLVTAQRWRAHFVPNREEIIEGYPDKTTRFVKLEIIKPASRVGMKLYELNFQSARLNQLHIKAARQRTQPQVSNPSQQVVSQEQLVKLNQVLDLTEHLQSDGTLNYQFPAGDWTILRFGHTTNGNKISPASERAGGLESDKMSKEALIFHLDEGLVKPVYERLGPLVGKVMMEMNIDSWEANCQTWTKTFPAEFETRRGYDMRKWLIALTGRFVGSVDQTERFMWDYRRTVGDLIAHNFYGAFREYVNEWGVKLSAEAPGIGIPIQCDNIQVQGMMDIPQGEFWLGGTPNPKFPHWTGGQDNTKEAAVAGHVYGKEIISCEAFTSFAHHDGYTQYPHILKPVGDRQFCKGMNEIVFHRYAHQPNDRVPGMGLGQFGLNLERTTTWWNPGRAWVTYLRRCQYMLRQGRFFADACYYYGEDVPGSAWYFVVNAMDPRQKMKPVLPLGYDYDVCDRTTFDTMTVENGFVALPSGMRYSYLVLPEHARYTPDALEKVLELVEAGATVIGPRPNRSPSMNDYPSADNKIQQIAAKLWPKAAGPGERRVGKGRVITGKSFETILAEHSLTPDFDPGTADVRYIHRKLAEGDLYFVAYQKDQTEDVSLTFRVTGMDAEAWNPETGEKSDLLMASDNGTSTTLSLRMESYGSQFILFRKKDSKNNAVLELLKDGKSVRSLNEKVEAMPELSPTFFTAKKGKVRLSVWESGKYDVAFKNGKTSSATVKKLPVPKIIKGNWTLTFQQERGAPAGEIQFDSLQSWTERPEAGIKYFSGTASYLKQIEVSADRLKKDRRVWLDLGKVNYLAEVFVNDKPLEVLWKPPYRVDITDVVKRGANKVEVKVTNVWKNRIIGDLKLPEAERVTWTLHPFYRNDPDAPLMESGLIGPVRVLSSMTVSLK